MTELVQDSTRLHFGKLENVDGGHKDGCDARGDETEGGPEEEGKGRDKHVAKALAKPEVP